MTADTRALGSTGEEEGVAFLKKNGYAVLERNYRTRYGEIDVIARHRKDLVFIEIKLRRSVSFGAPQEAVGLRKQEHIIRAALQYLKEKNLKREPVRFDVLALGPAPGAIELFAAAFTADSRYSY